MSPADEALSAGARAILAGLRPKLDRLLDVAEQASALTGLRSHDEVHAPGAPLSPEAVEAFERAHEVSVPRELRAFLLEVANGGPLEHGRLLPLSAPIEAFDRVRYELHADGEYWVHVDTDGTVEEDSCGEITEFPSFLAWYDAALDRMIARREAAIEASLRGGRGGGRD